MKGLTFTLKKRTRRSRPTGKTVDVKYIVRRYGTVIFFSLMLLVGLILGCVLSGKMSNSTLKRLDMLFTTNLPQRLSEGALGAFCASFGSNFIFLSLAFLLGLSLWGAAAMPIVSAFKGFGVGISAGYLISSYGLKGAVFYFTILLPGIILFSVALVNQLTSSYNVYVRIMSALLKRNRYGFRDAFRLYLAQSLYSLLLALGAAVIDVLLWCVFAGLFNFT